MDAWWRFWWWTIYDWLFGYQMWSNISFDWLISRRGCTLALKGYIYYEVIDISCIVPDIKSVYICLCQMYLPSLIVLLLLWVFFENLDEYICLFGKHVIVVGDFSDPRFVSTLRTNVALILNSLHALLDYFRIWTLTSLANLICLWGKILIIRRC